MTPSGYRFGAFRFDRVTYQLIHGEKALNLTPKLLDLLVFFLERPATLVTKEELLEALWPGANVTENALAQAVSELRHTLGDDPASPQFIRTIARRGYRFIASVTPSATTAERSHDRQTSSAGATSTGALPTFGDAAIAVLDFVVTPEGEAEAWLGTGIAETVTNDLRRLGHFRVVDRRRVVEAVRATDGSLDRIAAALGAGLLVVGSVQRIQQQVRITSRIVDVATGEARADAKVDGEIGSIFELQDEVVRQLARETAPPGRGAARDTTSLRAFQAFTEGWLALESLEVARMSDAVTHFERAVSADARYARAYAGLASAELACHESTRADNQPDETLLERAVRHAERAIALDDSLAEAHATLALVLVSAGRTEEAGRAGRQAVSLEPSNWRHWFRLGHATWGSERVRAATRTQALYPEFAFSHFQVAMVHVARRNLTEAETVLRQGAAVQDRQIARGGRYPALGLHWLLGMVRLVEDDVEEALEEFGREASLAELHRLYGREFQMHSWTGRAAALERAGRIDEAVGSLEAAIALYPDNVPACLALASVLSIRGQTDDATRLRERVNRALPVLERTRPLYAAVVKAEMLAASGDAEASGRALAHALRTAPPGFACWTIPIEPAFRDLLDLPSFAPFVRTLDDRAR